MNTDSTITPIRATEQVSVIGARSPSWGAIIAGLVAAMGVHFLMLMLGTAMGLGAAEPATDENPVATIGAGAAITWSISALVAMWVGGWVAGRCAVRVHSVSGGVHGFLVWCLATTITLFLITSGAGKLVGGASQLVGQGLTAAGEAAGGAAGGLGDMARAASEQNQGFIDSFIAEAEQSTGGNLSAAQRTAARREIGQAVRQLFAEGGDLRDPEARGAVVSALQRGANIDEAQANRLVESWVASMEQARTRLEEMKAAAATKAKELADRSAAAISRAAFWTFLGFLLGAITAYLAGRTGAGWEFRHTELADDPTFDPGHRRSHVRIHPTPTAST